MRTGDYILIPLTILAFGSCALIIGQRARAYHEEQLHPPTPPCMVWGRHRPQEVCDRNKAAGYS